MRFSIRIAMYIVAFFLQLALFLYEWRTHSEKNFTLLVPIFFLGNLTAYMAYYEATK
jgi:hypothetical protein